MLNTYLPKRTALTSLLIQDLSVSTFFLSLKRIRAKVLSIPAIGAAASNVARTEMRAGTPKE